MAVQNRQREAWAIERQYTTHFGHLPTDMQQRLETEPSLVDEIQVRDDVEDALGLLRHLPERLQRIALLRALGSKYREIGEVTGDSPVRVHVLVKCANDRLHDVLEARLSQEPAVSPRAERLRELEREQPA
jgi:DNA-directed RNA polymerase specialized sigma24 family protein